MFNSSISSYADMYKQHNVCTICGKVNSFNNNRHYCADCLLFFSINSSGFPAYRYIKENVSVFTCCYHYYGDDAELIFPLLKENVAWENFKKVSFYYPKDRAKLNLPNTIDIKEYLAASREGKAFFTITHLADEEKIGVKDGLAELLFGT